MCFWMAWKMIWENKKRSLFSLCGVLMGISSIIVIFSLAEGGKDLIKSDLSSLAENRIMIGGENLSVRDGNLLEDIPFVKYAFFPDAKRDTGEIILTGYSKKSLLAMGYPSNLKDREILLEENTSKKLYGSADPSGKEIELGDRKEKYIIRGVYKEKNPLESANDRENGITSLISLERMTGLNRFSKVVVSFYEEEDGEKLAPLIIDRLKKAHGGRGNYIIMENSGKYKKVEKIKNTLNIFLAAIGLVALIMGGLGISNLMAAMVRERTPHIGILRAMGAGKNFYHDHLPYRGCLYISNRWDHRDNSWDNGLKSNRKAYRGASDIHGKAYCYDSCCIGFTWGGLWDIACQEGSRHGYCGGFEI